MTDSLSKWISSWSSIRSRPSLSSLSFSPTSPKLPGAFASPLASNEEPQDEDEAHASAEVQLLMQEWLEDKLQEKEDDFLLKKEIRAWCSTFNVNDKQPRALSDIQPWLDSAMTSNAELLVFSFQEFDLTADALVRYTPYREDAWRKVIEEGLNVAGKETRYEKIHSRQLSGALILLYARADVTPLISQVSSASLATGLMGGWVANKGCVGIRLEYQDTPLTFLDSHLAAFTQHASQRTAQLAQTAETLRFAKEEKAEEQWTPSLQPLRERARGVGAGDGWSVWDSEAMVWMGDLNYRLDLSRPDVDQLVEKEEWELLQRFDQLKLLQSQDPTFTLSRFSEAPLTFPPTFKFDIGTLSTYDTSEKRRTPSWTDRILWLSRRKGADQGAVVCESYESCGEVTMSDHKPVSAVLGLPVYSIDAQRRKELVQELREEMERYDPATQPSVKLSPGPSVEFSRSLKYDTPTEETVELLNEGSTIVPWSFLPTSVPTLSSSADETPPPSSWLYASPSSGVLRPNERSTITLTARVNSTTSPSAATLTFPSHDSSDAEIGLGESKALALDALLVIKLGEGEGRKDLFLSVSCPGSTSAGPGGAEEGTRGAGWIPTVFGATLDQLVRLHQPFRSLSLEDRKALSESSQNGEVEEDGKTSVPQVLHRLVAFLADHQGVGVPRLFELEGEEELVRMVGDCLDTGSDFPVDRLLPPPAIRARPTLSHALSSDQQHLHDATTALQHLELERPFDVEGAEEGGGDIGSIPLSSPPLTTYSNPPSAPVVEDLEENDDQSSARFAGLHAVAATAFKLLDSLTEPVVPFDLYWSALTVTGREEAYDVVREMPEAAPGLAKPLSAATTLIKMSGSPQQANMLLYILAFLRVLLKAEGEKEGGAEKAARRETRLAIIFSAVLLRRPPPLHATSTPSAPHNVSPQQSIAVLEPTSVPRRSMEFIRFLLQVEDAHKSKQ
ncbi:hypothetical protein JCM11641_001710 [Rhodosporidiobolus odoratus]